MTQPKETRIYDLHSHSNCSDGSLAPQELAELMHSCGVSVFAITDHDTMQGVEEARLAALEIGLGFIPGVEISTCWVDVEVHIVGLGLEPQNSALSEFLVSQKDRRWRRAKAIARALDATDVEGAEDFLDGLDRKMCPGRIHFADFLVEQGYVKNREKAFKKYLGKGRSAYCPPGWPSINEACEIIAAAGGTSVLAHPSKYRLNRKKQRSLVRDFALAGGKAMEVVSGQAPINEIIYLARLAGENGLHSSIGSDFHDPRQGWIKPGQLADLPEGSRPVWELLEPVH